MTFKMKKTHTFQWAEEFLIVFPDSSLWIAFHFCAGTAEVPLEYTLHPLQFISNMKNTFENRGFLNLNIGSVSFDWFALLLISFCLQNLAAILPNCSNFCEKENIYHGLMNRETYLDRFEIWHWRRTSIILCRVSKDSFEILETFRESGYKW